MVQAGSSRGSLGHSITTPRVKIHAVPKGNYPPVYGAEASSPSTAHNVQQSAAPTANMIEPQARQNAAAPHPNSGNDRSPPESHIVRLPVRVTEPQEPGEIDESNGASSLASPPSEPVDTPIVISNVLPAPHLLDPTLEAARRYQEQADRVEMERDREDSTYPGPTPEPEDSPQASRSGGTRNTPRTRARATGRNKAFDEPPVMRPDLQQPVPGPSGNSVQQKRKAVDDDTAEAGHGQKRRQYTKRKHNNKRFELLKPASKAERTAVVKSIKSHWKISGDKLMELPYVPRRTTEVNHPVLKPLDWNTHLLEALEQLASLTKRDFVRGCSAAKEAFEERDFLDGSTQLTSEIVNFAVEKIRGVDLRREQPIAMNAASTDQPTLPQRAAERREQQGAVNAASLIQPIPPQHLSETVCQPMTVSAPNGPLDGHAASAGPSRTSTRAPPSPAVSHTSVPVKVEHAAAGAQSGNPASDDESSGTEERLDLESNRRILELELAIIREKLAVDDRRRKEKERKAARLRQHGGSVDDALLL